MVTTPGASVAAAAISSPVASVFGPADEKERIVLLDALRGFALFGVLLVNLRDLSLFGLLSATGHASLVTARWDHWLDLIMTAFVDAKAFTIFTILFGIGFALQAQRATASGRSMSHYLRRLLVLIIIGLLHAYLLWWGDILRLYAVLGLLLLPLGRMKPRTLAALGIIVAVFLTPAIQPIMASLLPRNVAPEVENAAAIAGFKSASLQTMLRSNLTHDIWTRISAWGLPFYVLGRLFIGAALGKSQLLWNSRCRDFAIRLLVVLLPIGIGLTAFVVLRDNRAFGPTHGWWESDMARVNVRIARSAASLALGLAYVGFFVLLFGLPRWRRWLESLAPVGRMALTNYISQTIIAIVIFYGIGFGVGPRFGMVAVLVSGVIIFAAQMAISHWWLKRFNFGPVEWLWRSLTYLKRQPMHRS